MQERVTPPDTRVRETASGMRHSMRIAPPASRALAMAHRGSYAYQVLCRRAAGLAINVPAMQPVSIKTTSASAAGRSLARLTSEPASTPHIISEPRNTVTIDPPAAWRRRQ